MVRDESELEASIVKGSLARCRGEPPLLGEAVESVVTDVVGQDEEPVWSCKRQ